MTEQQVFILSEEALKNVVDQIADEQWSLKVPQKMSRGKDLSLRDIINYHAYDDIWVPETLAGKTIEEVGDTYKGDLLGQDPKASFAKIVTAAIEAVQAVTDSSKVVHLTYGDLPISEYLKHITSFRGFRAYTLGRFIGVDTTLDPNLVQGMWDEFEPEVEAWRKMGVFGPAIAVPDGANLQTKLLCLTGFYELDQPSS